MVLSGSCQSLIIGNFTDVSDLFIRKFSRLTNPFQCVLGKSCHLRFLYTYRAHINKDQCKSLREAVNTASFLTAIKGV